MCFWNWLTNTFLKNSWDQYAFELSNVFNGLSTLYIAFIFFSIKVFYCVQRHTNLFMESRIFFYSWITQILVNNNILFITYLLICPIISFAET